MSKRKKRVGWSSHTLLRYTLFQIPSLALLAATLWMIRQYVDLPQWFFWGFMGLWVVKDAILFPFVWRAYDRSQGRALLKMIGQKGVAKERLNPSGYIHIHGELWKAEVMEGSPPIEREEPVWVEGVLGRVLLVRGKSKEFPKGSKDA